MPNNTQDSNNRLYSLNKNNNLKIAILGGGIGGSMTAFELSKKFPDSEITIFEKKNELLFGTSNCTPARMGLGFHYVHANSAITYLRQTIAFVKHFYQACPFLMIGQEFPEDNFLRNGRYFIVKNSSFPSAKILETYDLLSKEYAELVKLDKENEFFGNPRQFYRILKPKEYKKDVNLKCVDIAIETHEHLLDWPYFRSFLLNEITAHKNIKVLLGREIQDISYLYTQNAYAIHLKQEEVAVKSSHYFADFVINATWEWADYFNSKIGYYRPPNEIRTNRAKTLIKVKLPDELKEKNSMFFCMGPHCMFSNIGKGYGFITYAPETNLQNSTSLIPEKKYLDLINDRIPAEAKLEIAQNIIIGVSQYIPAMSKAEIVEVRFGTVQVEGEANIFDPSSKIHERDYMGLRYLEDGFISLTCMKLLYGHGNANTVASLFGEYKEDTLPIAQQIKDLTSKKFDSDAKTEDTHQNLNISLLAGLCFAWFKKSRPDRNKTSCIIPIESFCNDFFKKIPLNKEFKMNQHFKTQKNFGTIPKQYILSS